MAKDRYNPKISCKETVRQWFPPISEISFLWLAFAGKGRWDKGFWVHHPKTIYLDFQVVEEGSMTVHYGGQNYLIPAGSAVLIPPGESKLTAGSPGGCRKRFIGISGLILDNNLTGMNLNRVCVLNDFRSEEFDFLFDSLWRMTEEKKLENAREYCATVYRLLMLFSHCATQQPYPEELQRAITAVNQYFSQPLTLKDICLDARCGRSTLQWQFKHYMKSSPIRYLTETRMKYAAKLLEHTQFSIKEIAQKCGYSDQLYFSSSFRSHFGCSPRDYRKKAEKDGK